MFVFYKWSTKDNAGKMSEPSTVSMTILSRSTLSVSLNTYVSSPFVNVLPSEA